MKTDEVSREPKQTSRAASLALQDQAPLSYAVIDGRGKNAPLSSAGYVLRAGGKYRLRIVVSDDNDVSAVQVVNPPDFLKVASEVTREDDCGRQIHEVPFRVRRDLGAQVYKFGDVRCDELEIILQFRPESGKQARSCTYPIIVRPGLVPAALALAGGVLTVIVPALVKEAPPGGGNGDFLSKVGFWLADYRVWGGLLLIALLLLGLYAYSLWQVRRRARELQDEFRERYPQARSC